MKNLRVYIRGLKYVFKTVPKRAMFLTITTLIHSASFYFVLQFSKEVTDVGFKLYDDTSLNFFTEVRWLIFLIIILTAFTIVDSVIRVTQLRFNYYLCLKVKDDLYDNISNSSWETIEQSDVYNDLPDIKNRVEGAFLSIYYNFNSFLGTFIRIVTSIYVLKDLNTFVIIGFIIATIIAFVVGNETTKRASKIYRLSSKLWRRLNIYFRMGADHKNQQEFQNNRLYDFTSNSYEEKYNERITTIVKANKLAAIGNLLADLLNAAVISVALYFTVIIIIEGNATIGYFTIVSVAMFSLTGSMKSLMFTMLRNADRTVIVEKFFKVYDFDDFENETPYKNSNQGFDITFENVSYKYPHTDTFILEDFNLKIKKGEKIAIVGENGCGKTTLTNLLTGLTTNFTGSIMIGKNDINECITLLRNEVAIILQDFVQYQMTIRENIEMGNVAKEFSDDEINDILDKVDLSEFVLSTKNGIDQLLGQLGDGVELSKGQWQRIAIARLLAKTDAKVWVLDEPTAYLDPLAEIKMYNFINELAADRTVLFISHRLGFAKNADRVILIGDKKVLEQGTHDELIKLNGKYKSMFQTQKDWYK